MVRVGGGWETLEAFLKAFDRSSCKTEFIHVLLIRDVCSDSMKDKRGFPEDACGFLLSIVFFHLHSCRLNPKLVRGKAIYESIFNEAVTKTTRSDVVLLSTLSKVEYNVQSYAYVYT